VPKKPDTNKGWKRKPKVDLAEGALGTQMRRVREAADLKTVDLEGLIGVSNVSITRIESGENNPSKQTLMLYAQEFGETFEIEWLQKYLQEWRLRMRKKWSLVPKLRVQRKPDSDNQSKPDNKPGPLVQPEIAIGKRERAPAREKKRSSNDR
jgi:transcriptional regulator with XRE-family HTH domain